MKPRAVAPLVSLLVLAALGLPACSSSKSAQSGAPAAGGTGGSGSVDSGTNEDFAATEADFTCILTGTKVRHFYVKNALGHEAASLAVANAGSGAYPVGTILQLVPQEAMVKRKKGFSADSDDWEFFSLTAAATGTTIVHRGTTDVLNAFNLNCLDCHVKAEPQYDFVCETNHGCDPLPIGQNVILSLQTNDPRCAADAGP